MSQPRQKEDLPAAFRVFAAMSFLFLVAQRIVPIPDLTCTKNDGSVIGTPVHGFPQLQPANSGIMCDHVIRNSNFIKTILTCESYGFNKCLLNKHRHKSLSVAT